VAHQDRPFVATWKIILAFVLDLITAFSVIGYAVAVLAGQTTERGFQLNGAPALLAFGLIIAYFIIGARTGGTLWARLLGAVRRH